MSVGQRARPHRQQPDTETTMAIANRWFLRGPGLLLGLLMLGGCEASQPEAPVVVVQEAAEASARSEETRMWMTVGERRFAITLADTAAAGAFAV